MRELARERIDILFNMAVKVYPHNKELARRYVFLAFKIAMRARIRIPRRWRWRYCKKCFSPMIPGVNALVRIKPKGESYIVIHCLDCGNIYRIPLKRRDRGR
ncbi:MAG: ribonuclease P [Thermoprotei archaeon]|nr:MAG: ribonuclease P [Thermoprotei archaeon]RLF20409.1 MAG: ribonuclease P [Thermoprotei archaeon]